MESPPPENERLLRVINEHWVKYIFPVFFHVLLTGVSLLLFFFAGLSAHHMMWLSHATFLLALFLLLLTHHWFFAVMLGEAIDCVILTNLRSIHMETRLLFHDEMRENSFDKMRTIEASKEGILQNLLHYGTLRFQGGGDIPLVPHPHRIAKEIEQAMGRK